jgi:hypothetical protein
MPTSNYTEKDYRYVHAEIQRGLSRTPPSPPSSGHRAAAKTPALARSLRSGQIEPAIDPGDDAIQKLAALFWRVEPPTLWILALSLIQGESFAFRPALERHLREEPGQATGILLMSTLVRLLAQLISMGRAAAGLRERLLAWELQTCRTLVPLPSASFDDGQAEDIPIADFDDGLNVNLTAVREVHLHLCVRQPANAENTKVDLHLIGDTGEHRTVECPLIPTGGYADLGTVDELTGRLGARCVAITAKQPPPPELFDLAAIDLGNLNRAEKE